MEKYYLLPFVIYVAGTAFAGQFEEHYPLLYLCVVVLTGGVILRSWPYYKVLQPHWKIFDAVFVGLVGIVLWIALCHLNLEARIAESLPTFLKPKPRVALNPFGELSTFYAWGFIVVRMIGLTILVPVVEEVFWRGFLARWLVADDWEDVPIGKLTLTSFLIVTLLFTTAHPEWFAAAMYCSLLNGYLIWKKDLWSCVIAHAVSNFSLGVYVLTTAQYQLW